MTDKGTEINKEINSSNIFDEFNQDSNLIDEVDKIKNERNKDIYFYITKIASILQIFFWIGLLIVVIMFSYISIQKNEEYINKPILDPFCYFFLGDIKNQDSYCSSISSLKIKIDKKLSTIKNNQTKETLFILEKLYKVENFTKSNDVLFLTAKSMNKLKILSILEAFDDMKNEFDSVDKEKIQCTGLDINGKTNIISMNCVAYSAGFEKGLRGFDGGREVSLKGSSLSMANSFLNFINIKSDFFTIVDRQKIFKSENIFGDNTDFTNMTKFNLKLKYNLQ